MSTNIKKFYNLKNGKYEENLTQSIKHVLQSSDFFDVSLVCGKEVVKGHKLILSANSDIFNEILTTNPHPHPLIYMKDVAAEDMKNIINFMYNGEVDVDEKDISHIMKLAHELQIKGLMEETIDSQKDNVNLNYVDIKNGLNLKEPSKEENFGYFQDFAQKPFLYGRNNINFKYNDFNNSLNQKKPHKEVTMEQDSMVIDLEDVLPKGIEVNDNTLVWDDMPIIDIENIDTNLKGEQKNIESGNELNDGLQLMKNLIEDVSQIEISNVSNINTYNEACKVYAKYLENIPSQRIVAHHRLFECKICKKQLRKSHFLEHIEIQHIGKRKMYSCRVENIDELQNCHFSTGRFGGLRRHLKTEHTSVYEILKVQWNYTKEVV